MSNIQSALLPGSVLAPVLFTVPIIEENGDQRVRLCYMWFWGCSFTIGVNQFKSILLLSHHFSAPGNGL